MTLNGAPATLVVEVTTVTWWPGVGLIAEGSPGGFYSSYVGIMTLDGRFCDRSNSGLDYAGWWPAKSALVQIVGHSFSSPRVGQFELIYEPIVFTPERSGPYEGDPVNHPLYLKQYVKLADRCIFYEPNGTSISTPEGPRYEHSFRVVVDGVEIDGEGPPHPFTGQGGSTGRLHPGRSDTEVFVTAYSIQGDTQAAFYDTATKTWSSPVYRIGMVCYGGLVYCSDFGVMVSTHNWVSNPDELGSRTQSNQLRVWSLEVNPTIMTDVEVAEGEVKSGQVVTYRVQVTGDQDDPAEGELVNWFLTGAGFLLTMQSKTDEDGYATAQVQYGVAETGESKVEATLIC